MATGVPENTPWSSGYSWTQTQERLTITFELPLGVNLVDVDVVITAKEIRGGVHACPFRIAGTLHQEVLPNSSWQMETNATYQTVKIYLEKAVHIEWSFPIQGDCGDGLAMDGQSEFELAKFYHSLQDYSSALQHLRQATDKGNIAARIQLGKLYQLGTGDSPYPLKKDVTEATAHYLVAAEHNSGEAQFLLGSVYQQGDGVAKSHSEAVKWYKRCVSVEQQMWDSASDQTHRPPLHVVTALFNLGIIYQSGKNDVPVNYDEAIKWWHEASKFNFAPAVYNIGIMYLNGSGVKKDEAMAREYFIKAHNLNPNLSLPDMNTQDPASPLSPSPSDRRKGSSPAGSGSSGSTFMLWTAFALAALGGVAMHFLRKRK